MAACSRVEVRPGRPTVRLGGCRVVGMCFRRAGDRSIGVHCQNLHRSSGDHVMITIKKRTKDTCVNDTVSKIEVVGS